ESYAPASTCAHFLHVGADLLVDRVAERDRNDRQLLVDERVRAVLHLSRRRAFGVDVRELLELERALERGRVVHAAPEEEEVVRAVVAIGERLDLRLLLQDGVDEGRQMECLRKQLARTFRI